MEDEVKVGNRNNAGDRAVIRSIRKLAREITDHTVALEPSDDDEPTMIMDVEKSVIVHGGEIKAVRQDDGLHVGGYLVKFTDAAAPDLAGDYFTPATEYGLDFPAKIPVYFNHGMDKHFKNTRISRATVTKDEFGLWAETILQERDEYEKFIAELALSGKAGWSSGAAGHLVSRKAIGGANEITSWPIAEGSITHTPCEPKGTVIVPLKSLSLSDPEGEPGAEQAASDGAVTETKNQTLESPNKEDKMSEVITMTDEQLKQYGTDIANSAVEAALKSLPAEKSTVAVVKDEGDQPFESAGAYFQAVKNAAMYPHQADAKLKKLEAKANGINEATPADGGYLVPPQYASGIIEKMYGTGKILSTLNVDTVTGNSMTYNAVDETSRVDGSRIGGVQGYWRAEAAAITASKPKFRQVELKLKSVYALAYATDEMLEDVSFLNSWLGRVVPDELRFKVEDAVFEGDGNGKPTGITAAGCLVSVLRYATSSINYVDILNMWARRYAAKNDYVWFVNQDVTPQLDAMVLSGSTEIPLRFIDYGPDGVMKMKGRPVIEVEYASTMGTVGDIVLASMSEYLAIQKGGVQAASSIHVAFTTAEQAFRFGYRFDGGPSWASALTPFKGTNTVSPFVALATATS